MNKILNIEVSKFSSFNDVNPTSVNLLNWLVDKTCLPLQDKVRAIEDKGQRDIEKGKLPCITPSGTFSKRGANNLIKHSGLIQVDIDFKGNEQIENYYDLKKELCKIPNVAYCGLSVSGKGFWLLIPIAFPDKHKQHFEFIRRYFEAKGLTIDKACSDVSRLRVYAYDPEAYFNHAATPLNAFYEPQPQKIIYNQKTFTNCDTPVYKQYNDSNDYEQVLFNNGWQFDHKQGNEIYYTRPGKTKGISAGFNIDLRTFYVFTDGSSFEPNTGYSAFAVYAILEHAGDYKKATLALSNKQIKRPATILMPVVKKPSAAPLRPLFDVRSNDILDARSNTCLAEEFGSAIICYVQTPFGNYDLLFNSEGELLQPDKDTLIESINSFFEKGFMAGFFDGKPCFVHNYK